MSAHAGRFFLRCAPAVAPAIGAAIGPLPRIMFCCTRYSSPTAGAGPMVPPTHVGRENAPVGLVWGGFCKYSGMPERVNH